MIDLARQPELLAQIDPLCWAVMNKLRVAGGEFTVYGHEYQIEPLRQKARKQVMKKATQRGYSEAYVIRTLHSLRYGRFPQGAMVIFPSADEVSVFSKSRFKPFLSNNSVAIGQYVKETDSVDVKRVGNAFLYFRGARLTQNIEGAQKSSSKLKSTPVDCVVFDELDEMDQDAIPLALARMQHSHIKEEIYMANPTVPDYGIDKLYSKSDQRIWLIECQSCGRETSLDLEFPNCFKYKAGGHSAGKNIINIDRSKTVYRACKHCEAELFPKNGYWIPQKPDRDFVGYWDSQLGSIFSDPASLLREYQDPDTDQTRFHNLKLGKAYIASENKLTVNDVYLCCSNDSMSMGHAGPCAAGVDVGDTLHVLIAQKIGDQGCKIIKAARVSTFNDVWDLCRLFGVSSIVFDAHPELHKVREYCSAAPYSAFGCVYSEEQIGIAAWNETSRTITVNRTELCDATHKLVTAPGSLSLPRKDAEIEIVAKQITSVVKVIEEKKDTGVRKYRYRKIGEDHYRHALNYLLLALSRVKSVNTTGIVTQQPIQFYYG